MSYFVTCTFDLKNASRDDYSNAYADLKAIGLKKTVVPASGGEVVAPTTMTMGEFSGDSVTAVRDAVADAVKSAFAKRRFSSEIFVVAASGWGWTTTKTY